MPRYVVQTSRSTRYKKKGGNRVYKRKTAKKAMGSAFTELKHDVMLASAKPVLGQVTQADATINLPVTGMGFTIWSPSYRVASNNHRPRDREQTKCQFVGVKENILFMGEGNVLHRRVVFWSRVSIDEALPFIGQNDTMLRNIKILDPDRDLVLDQFLGGTRGQDFLAGTIFHRKFDGNAVDVVYDKVESYAQPGTVLKNRKLWHSCRKVISYQDKESGMDISRSGWSGLASGSGGNLYIVDMYVCRGTQSANMNVSFSSEVYWRESK